MSDNQERNLEKMRQEFGKRHMSQEQVNALKDRMEQAKRDRRRLKFQSGMRKLTAVAAAVAIFVILPNTSPQVAHAMSGIPVIGKLVDVITFRDYNYSSDRHNAQVKVPEIVADGGENQENLQKSADEINAEIQEIANKFIAEFEEGLKFEEGYQDVIVNSEVVTTAKEYFTLKLDVYQGAGSGSQWNYYYTIDLSTGDRLALKDLFVDGADYITPISEDIKKQMRDQMAQDEDKVYWLDYEEVPAWNFEAITEETQFYVDANNNLVISFDEGEVAPMAMGIVTFTITPDVIADIRK